MVLVVVGYESRVWFLWAYPPLLGLKSGTVTHIMGLVYILPNRVSGRVGSFLTIP